MWDGFLSFGDVELLNKARTAAYLKRFAPDLEILCDDYDGVHNALGHNVYQTPALDGAPWYRQTNPDTAEFLGLFPGSVLGDQDSTREVAVTELSSDGGVHSLARHGSKEIRVRGVLFATTPKGLDAGMTWLRNMLDDSPCGQSNMLNCEGRELRFFTVSPGAATEAEAIQRVADYGRVMYRVEPLDGPRIVLPKNYRSIYGTEIEFILNAGVPWAFTFPEPVATTTNVTAITTAETYCETQADSYDALVVDPQQPSVSRPPRPPQIESVAMPASWSRYTMTIGSTYGQRAGRLVPLLTVNAGTAARRQMRVRFYRTGNSGACDFEGEFYITYMPANSVLTIDGTTRETVIRVAGVDKPAGNLVLGSNGRPPRWPSMACDSSYQVVVDTVGGIADASVLTEVSIRE